jgi:hypothetical protein
MISSARISVATTPANPALIFSGLIGDMFDSAALPPSGF